MKAKTQKEVAEGVLDFFKTAFVAEKAEFVTPECMEKLQPGIAIKITTNDGRGSFYAAQMKPKHEWERK